MLGHNCDRYGWRKEGICLPISDNGLVSYMMGSPPPPPPKKNNIYTAILCSHFDHVETIFLLIMERFPSNKIALQNYTGASQETFNYKSVKGRQQGLLGGHKGEVGGYKVKVCSHKGQVDGHKG